MSNFKSLSKAKNINSSDISLLVMKNVEKYLNKHPRGKGLWYPDDFFKYIKRKGINLSDASFDPSKTLNKWYDGYANPKFFDKIGPFVFKAKPGILPSDALMAFLEGPTIADCGNATLVIYYKTYLDIVGSEEFNKLYNGNFIIKYIMDNPIDRLIFVDIGANYIESEKKESGKKESGKKESGKKGSQDVGCIGDRPLIVGELLHFGCVKWYANKHPAGFGGGWNVIYGGKNDNGEQIFYAHGLKKPLTEKEINRLCIKDYNLKRTMKDFQYIKDEDKPGLHNKKHNKWLNNYYKIDHNEMENNPNKFLEGFLPHTRVFLPSKLHIK
jgi:hypothetical protein